MIEQDLGNVDEFFRAIAPLRAGYANTTFNYLAVKHGKAFVLVQGRVQLQVGAPNIPLMHFASENVRAGQYRISELGMDARELVEAVVKGSIPTPHGVLTFPLPDNGTIASVYQPFHNETFQSQARLDLLTLQGANRKDYLRQPHLDWELRSAETPYNGLADLVAAYNLGAFATESLAVEFAAFNVAAVDASGSTIAAEKATLGLLLAPGLEREKVRLGYVVFCQPTGIVKRGLCEGSGMRWGDHEGLQRGISEIDVPRGAVLHCFASYAGVPQHHYWVADPTNTQNPRRSIYQAFDGNLEILQGFFANPNPKYGADDLESGVAWLMWMLGFSVAHLGGTQKTRDAPDLIAIAPHGHVAVIECTTGLLKAENKLPRLLARTETIRTRLKASGNDHLRVLPVIVTSMTREEIKADVEQAERLGVGILAREDLLEALGRTLIMPDAQRIYDEGEKNVRVTQAKYESDATGSGATGTKTS